MRIKSKTASIVWKIVLLVVGAYGLLDGAGILAGAYDSNFPHMFTNVSNLFAWLYFLCAVIWLCANRGNSRKVTFAPVAKYTATISLLVTMLIAHFMLFDAMFKDGQIVMHLVALHYVVPLMTLFDWLLFDEKGKMPKWGPFAWMSLVLAYLAVVMIAAGPLGIFMGGGTTADVSRYPYTFLDPEISGIGGVVTFCVAMFVAFIVLGFALYGLDRLMGRKRKLAKKAKRMAKKYPISDEFFPLTMFAAPINLRAIKMSQKVMGVPKFVWRDPELSVVSHSVPGYQGAEIEVLVIAPKDIERPAPCFIDIHGGGFVFDAAPYQYHLAMEYARQARCIAAFVRYRLAPDFPFPVPNSIACTMTAFASRSCCANRASRPNFTKRRAPSMALTQS